MGKGELCLRAHDLPMERKGGKEKGPGAHRHACRGGDEGAPMMDFVPTLRKGNRVVGREFEKARGIVGTKVNSRSRVARWC